MSYYSEGLEPEMYAGEIYAGLALFEIAKRRLNELEEEARQRSMGRHHRGFWTMKNGQRIAYKDMTDTHLSNAIAMLKRNWGL